jgi:signal transduction histidine kinase
VVDEILMTLHPTLKRTPYRVETEIPEDLELDSYPGPLGQALTNLINNAVIHGFENRDHGTIRITAAAKPPGKIAVSVGDDGRGIPAERLGRIFDPFYTTRMGRGGTGLGLHVVHSLVTNVLGGTLTVSSREEEGTEFVMLLPERAPSKRA